jgi:hypothetical protein
MISLADAQIDAQLASLVVFALLAAWFAVPLLRRLGRAEALIAITSIHLFRYVTLLTYSARHDGYPISDLAAAEAVIGDVVGAAIALVTVGLLHARRQRWSLAFSWLLVIATAADFAVGIHRKAVEPLWGAASGVTWLILNFYVPLLMVSLPILVWQLCARTGEPFSARPVHRKAAAAAGGQNSAE